ATEAVYFAAGAAALARFGHRVRWHELALRPLIATAVFALALLAARSLPLLGASLVASLAYAVATLALRVFARKAWELLYALARPRRPARGRAPRASRHDAASRAAVQPPEHAGHRLERPQHQLRAPAAAKPEAFAARDDLAPVRAVVREVEPEAARVRLAAAA